MKYLVPIIISLGLGLAILVFAQDIRAEKNNQSEVCVSPEEMKLYRNIMTYREKSGLPAIPLSSSLTYIAQQHCIDLQNNKPDLGNGCNAHSWSDKGRWTSCCYTSDHKQAACMWKKPSELTNYTGYGFEIACGSSDPRYNGYVMTADYAISAWQKSKFHNQVIVNDGAWKNYKWNAIGIGIYKGFAVVWFGKETDSGPEVRVCK